MLATFWRRLRRAIEGWRAPGTETRRRYARVVGAAVSRQPVAAKREATDGRSWKEYVAALPEGYGARYVTLRLSLPLLPPPGDGEFTEHTDGGCGPTATVIVARRGGFALSDDLGGSWRSVGIAGYGRRRVAHVKGLGDGRFLVQAEPAAAQGQQPSLADVLVVNEAGEILARTASLGAAWHSCRAVGMRDGVIMFAEYPPNAKADRKYPSRVFRSRDGGHTWTVAFQRSPDDIRHFHFLQPRPGAAGEWWLTSGDAPHESRIWVTRDDGGTWTDISGATERTAIGTARFGHDLYRLTDLAWLGDEVIWGTDDVLFGVKGAEPGARLFRSPIGAPLAPTIAGHARWHIRSLVDVGDHYVVISQGCPEPRAVARAEAAPGVYLMPKSAAADAPAMLHLFDIDTYSRRRTGFTYARASRAAKDGVFFTFRARTDVFPSGPQILKWEIAFA